MALHDPAAGSAGSNRLPVLADEIRRAHDGVLDAAKTTAERAIDAGNALVEAKALVGHGNWRRWLAEHCRLPERTAQFYMKIARSGLESATIADLGLKAAAQAVVLHMPDPFDGDGEEALNEWVVYCLWFVCHGVYAEDAWRRCNWIRRNGWRTPSEWVGSEGDKWRAAWGMRPLCDADKMAWAAFLAANLDRPRQDVEAEIQRLAEAQPEPEAEPPTKRKRRR